MASRALARSIINGRAAASRSSTLSLRGTNHFATRKRIDVGALASDLMAGKRMALSRAVTLVESSREDHVEAAAELLDTISSSRASTGKMFRLGLAGPPGAGKSTLIEALGTSLVKERDMKVAVLAIDPSSSFTGGSIMGDKTRMDELSKLANAFVRPSPSRGTLGGIARRTHDVVALCEAAGFDLLIVESVGLGQSETMIDDVVDMTVLVVPPAGGDSLQGVKRGIMEVADMVVVNKADGDLMRRARHAAVDVRHALQLMRRKRRFWKPRVKMCSALDLDSVKAVWEKIETFRKASEASGELHEARAAQRAAQLSSEFERELLRAVRRDDAFRENAAGMERRVKEGNVLPRRAAAQLVQGVLKPE